MRLGDERGDLADLICCQHGAVFAVDFDVGASDVEQICVELFFGFDVLLIVFPFHLEERRLGDIDVAGLDQLGHLAVEEGQKQRADMGAVHIGIGHDDNAVIAEFGDVEIIIQSASDRGDHRLDLLVFQHLVLAGLLDVEEFSADGQDRLEQTVPSLFCGTACRISLDDVEFADGGILAGAVGQFSGQGKSFESAFSLDQLSCLAGGFAGVGGHDGLADNIAGDLGILLQERAQALIDHGGDDSFDLTVSEFGFCLSFELGIRDLDADHGAQSFQRIRAGHGPFALQQIGGLAVCVDDAGQRGLEARKMGSALERVDVVGVGVDGGGEGVVVLHGNFDIQPVLRLVHIDHRMERFFPFVEHGHEFGDSAFVEEDLFPFLSFPFIGQRDADAAVEERQFAEAVFQDLPLVDRCGEDLLIGFEDHGCSAVGNGSELFQRLHGHAPFESDLIRHSAPVDLDLHPLGEGVHAGDADSVQTAGYLVGIMIEFSARMQDGHHDFDGGFSLFVHIDRDSASVVGHADAVVGLDDHFDMGGVTGESLVDAVVDRFIYEVMRPLSPVSPMYMLGVFRTASSPSSTVILDAVY